MHARRESDRDRARDIHREEKAFTKIHNGKQKVVDGKKRCEIERAKVEQNKQFGINCDAKTVYGLEAFRCSDERGKSLKIDTSKTAKVCENQSQD